MDEPYSMKLEEMKFYEAKKFTIKYIKSFEYKYVI